MVRFPAGSAFAASVVLVTALGCAGEDGLRSDVQAQEAALAASSSVEGRIRCAVEDPGVLEADALQAEASETRFFAAKSDDKIRVPVHFHVITTSSGGGDVSALVPAQIDVLNTAFARSNIKFRLASVEVVANDDWFFSEIGSPEEVAMKAALRRGGSNALNFYSTLGDVYLGWATFPSEYRRDPLYDGVVVYLGTLPGGGAEGPDTSGGEPDGWFDYDEGDTGTHEVGHWLGLLHTFDGGCTERNDRIKDTPAQGETDAIFFCAQADTCTGRKFPGFDPIHNYMSYQDDQCLFEFTEDQTRRMRNQWDRFRD